MSTKRSAIDIVSEAYEDIAQLHPTAKEIQAYADFLEKKGRCHGVVTYSKSRRPIRSGCFIRFHNTWKQKIGGRVHIDVGYVDEEYVDQRDVPDTTHLMLDKNYASDFVKFIKERRRNTHLQSQ